MSIGLLLSLIFMVLKLCGIISWPWFKVFIPMMAEIGLYILVVISIRLHKKLKNKF